MSGFGLMLSVHPVEIKKPRGRVRPEQALWLELVRARGGIAIVARSAEDAVAQLREAQDAELPEWAREIMKAKNG
jgi:hypothetical protein